MWIVAGLGFLTSVFVFFFGFIPTESVQAEGRLAMVAYVACLLVGVVVFVTFPLVAYHRAVKNHRVVPEAVPGKVPPGSGAAVSH